MTVRNLDALFAPRTVALVGASNQKGSIGSVLAANLTGSGFKGPILPVNPHATAVRSVLSYGSIADLPGTPDLAVIATPPATVPQIVADLGRKGCRAAVVISAGLGHSRDPDSFISQALRAGRPHLMRLLGPNCLGVIVPGVGLNASFAPTMPAPGDIAFVTQSGAVATAVLDWAAGRGIGFSHVVSVGDMADIDLGDLLDYLALDAGTRAILLYVEAVTDARKFMSAGRIAARTKPVIVMKAARSAEGAVAATSHTGALAGADAVYDAAFRRAGMLRVAELSELFAAAEVLARRIEIEGDGLTILTNGGGLGVIAADAVVRFGGRLAALPAEVAARLDKVLPATWSRGNPVDIIGDAGPARYQLALEALLDDPRTGPVLVMNCPTAVSDSTKAAEAVAEVAMSRPQRTVLATWVGGEAADRARAVFAPRNIASFVTPEAAARAFMHLVDHRRNQAMLLRAPASPAIRGTTNLPEARAIVAAALAAGRHLLSEPESKVLLAAFGIPVAEAIVAAGADEAVAAAARLSGRVVLKVLSPDITHKSDVGGVRLDVPPGPAVRQAATEMLDAVRARAPSARIEGLTVQPMVLRRGATELLLGLADDPSFGTVVVFGQGGTATEIVGDRAIALPPLDAILAGDVVASTRVARLLGGYRDRPPAHRAAIVDALVGLSDLAVALPEVKELDINPLLADADGVIALDARVVLRQAGDRPQRLAVRPYPAGLERTVTLPSRQGLLLRPARPDDAEAVRDMLAGCAPGDLLPGFAGGAEAEAAARLTLIDYDREMTLLLADAAGGTVTGLARLRADPDNLKAEIATLVRSDRKDGPHARALLEELIAEARRRGIGTIAGEIAADDAATLGEARGLGFAVDADGPDGSVRVSLALRRP